VIALQAAERGPDLPPATGYSYALPGGWVQLAVDPARRVASVRRAVSGRVRREPRLAPYLAQLDRLLLHECAVAAARGAERVSLLAEVADGAIASAAVTFAVASLPGSPRAPAAPAVLSHLAAQHARARRHDPAATMTLVALAQQDAVRREWAEPADDAQGRPASRSWQLVVPWPGRASVGLLTLSSPAAPLWPLLGPVFDACCATFHWTFDPVFDERSFGRGPGPDRDIAWRLGTAY
jgi:hypothetical protein